MAKPTHTLFHVIESKDGKDNFWLKIGAGWEHKDGDGISLATRSVGLSVPQQLDSGLDQPRMSRSGIRRGLRSLRRAADRP
jgi:hypothetical protein